MSKVLIIEDELAIAELEKDYLELSDFEVTIEEDGTAGLDKALTGEYDIIILGKNIESLYKAICMGFFVCTEVTK